MTTVQPDYGFIHPVWSFADRVRKARDIAGLNQREFAAAIEVSEGSLATWETGRAKPRDIVAVAKRIQLATRVPAMWTLGIDETPDGDGGPTAAEPTVDKSSWFIKPGGEDNPATQIRDIRRRRAS